MEKYRSKVDWWIPACLLAPVAFVIVFAVKSLIDGEWIVAVMIAPHMVFMAFALTVLSTFYTIDEDILTVRSGVLVNQKIKIDKIKSVRATRKWISSPALSADRIEVRYGKYGSVIISPERKEQFIKHLVSINPNIETD